LRPHITAEDDQIPQRLATTIFRCAQELLNNVAKHAKARRVTVVLVREAGSVTLMVCDDGIGMPTADSSGSFGIGHGVRNLRERTQMTGGKLTWSENEGGGTRARVDWLLSAVE
jgi:signal transduction histidine kinase